MFAIVDRIVEHETETTTTQSVDASIPKATTIPNEEVKSDDKN